MKKRSSIMAQVREMMEAPRCLSHFTISEPPSKEPPSQELIDCAIEVTRIVHEAEADICWERMKQGIMSELLWMSEEKILDGIAIVVCSFLRSKYGVEGSGDIKEQAETDIELCLARMDGEIH